MDVVVFGSSNMYTAALSMYPPPQAIRLLYADSELVVGLTPAIEGDSAAAPESAMRKLLTSTAEMLACYIPKVGAHQRNIHGGGVFDEDLISGEILAQRR